MRSLIRLAVFSISLALAAGAHADAAPDLVAEAGALALRIKSEGLQAEPMLVGQRAQGL